MARHTFQEPDADLYETVERQSAMIERLGQKVTALADASGVSFSGACSECEDGLLLTEDGALVCSNCSFTHLL